MKIIFLVTSVVFMLPAAAMSAELGIELKTCMPDGIVNSMKEKYDPKKFWIAQNVILEIHLERRWEFADAMSRCKEIADKAEQIKCASYQQNLHASVVRCFQTTKRMCRANGGLC